MSNLIKLDEVRVTNDFENVHFSLDSLNILDVIDLLLVKDLDCHFLPSNIMHSQFYFPKRSFTYGFAFTMMKNYIKPNL
jgi:hypothetical protein